MTRLFMAFMIHGQRSAAESASRRSGAHAALQRILAATRPVVSFCRGMIRKMCSGFPKR
jgi:hypothetical protein